MMDTGEPIQYRRIDDLGRIVIPKSFRKQLGIDELDELQLELTNDGVVVSKKGDE